jgi:hypothetical protein
MTQKLRTSEFVRQLRHWRPLNALPKHPQLLVACCLLAALFHTVAARAQSNFVWRGDNNDNWQNSANWNRDPCAGDVPDGSGD